MKFEDLSDTDIANIVKSSNHIIGLVTSIMDNYINNKEDNYMNNKNNKMEGYNEWGKNYDYTGKNKNHLPYGYSNNNGYLTTIGTWQRYKDIGCCGKNCSDDCYCGCNLHSY